MPPIARERPAKRARSTPTYPKGAGRITGIDRQTDRQYTLAAVIDGRIWEAWRERR